ncbi:MAG: hypothetical protein CMJ48_01000 [Planctomycetaceae bacterium]|nr:hypothetical protein [Planctomycetaceae bacterium]
MVAAPPQARRVWTPAKTLEGLDALLEEWGDRLNPILIKETRQVLKGRQFLSTFLIMLAVAWLMSLVGISRYGGDLQFREAGPEFFRYYYWLLMFTLYVVVPLGVFRSVTEEFVEKTFETLAVTPMSAGMIVRGKLQSAGVQMAAYASVLTPFLCFTYMLRGIGLVEILLLLGILLVVAWGLSFSGMMLASLAKKSGWEVFNMILLLGTSFIAMMTTAPIALAAQQGSGLPGLIAGGICAGVFFLFVALLSLGVATAQLSPTLAPVPRYGYQRSLPRGPNSVADSSTGNPAIQSDSSLSDPF